MDQRNGRTETQRKRDRQKTATRRHATRTDRRKTRNALRTAVIHLEA